MKKSDPFQTDPFLQPNVMTMTMPALKSELNRLKVFVVGNPPKSSLQDKLLTAYADELLDKVALHYRNFQKLSVCCFDEKQEEVSCYHPMHPLPDDGSWSSSITIDKLKSM